MDRYKWISIKYDQDRDDQFEELNNLFAGNESEEYLAKRDEIRWDIAWQIFDEVNEDVDSDQEIDLHGLDVEEAQAITKQKICDIAQMASDEHQKGLQNNVNHLKAPKKKNYVLAILCGEEHFTEEAQPYQPSTPEMIMNGQAGAPPRQGSGVSTHHSSAGMYSGVSGFSGGSQFNGKDYIVTDQ